MKGESNKVIARKLDITEATIKVHVKAILRKIGRRQSHPSCDVGVSAPAQRDGASGEWLR